MNIHPIGVIHSPHNDPAHGPIQPCYDWSSLGKVEVFPEYEEGLSDLEGYSHIYLIYYFHKAHPSPMLAEPFLQKRKHGLFATRLPGRPNPIGLSLVKLLGREGRFLNVAGIDALDQSPLLDIKPYSRRFDCIPDASSGWQDEVSDTDAQVLGKR